MLEDSGETSSPNHNHFIGLWFGIPEYGAARKERGQTPPLKLS